MRGSGLRSPSTDDSTTSSKYSRTVASAPSRSGVVQLLGVVELRQGITLLDDRPVGRQRDERDTVPLSAGNLGYLDGINPGGAHKSSDTDERRRRRLLRPRTGIRFYDILRARAASGERQREQNESEWTLHEGVVTVWLDVRTWQNV